MNQSSDTASTDLRQVIADLERELTGVRAGRDEARQQQKASAETLRLINASVADSRPVFDKILDSCKFLFGGDELDILLVDDEGQLRVAAYVGNAHDAVMATFPAPIDGTPAGRAIRERRVAHFPDVLNNPDTPRVLRRMGETVGYHSIAFAPMIWRDQGVGAVGVARASGAFSGFMDQRMGVFALFVGNGNPLPGVDLLKFFDELPSTTAQRDVPDPLLIELREVLVGGEL